VRHSAALPEAAPNARLVRASDGASERAPPNRAATRERTTVRAPRRDVGPRSVNSALGEPPPRLAVVMAVPLTLGRGARGARKRRAHLMPVATGRTSSAGLAVTSRAPAELRDEHTQECSAST